MSSIRIQLGLVSGLFMFSLGVFGQTFRGGIAGNVADTTGAAIPEATVKIEQTATGLTRTATTPKSGEVDFPDLLTGQCTATVNRRNQNNWHIDGVDNNDFWHNAEAVNQGSISGIAGVLLPIDAIDQFNQQASGGADFGRNPGSMVNVVLKSGTNDFHGSAYSFNRNDALAAHNPFLPVDAFDPAIKNHQ